MGVTATIRTVMGGGGTDAMSYMLTFIHSHRKWFPKET